MPVFLLVGLCGSHDIPMQSEAGLVVLILAKQYPVLALIAVATVGNVLELGRQLAARRRHRALSRKTLVSSKPTRARQGYNAGIAATASGRCF